MKQVDILENIALNYPDLLTMDGYDDCIMGVIHGSDTNLRVCYSKDKVITKLMNGGMDYDEANEYHDFNQVCAYMGEHTPVFMQDLD